MSWNVEGTYFENCNCTFACPCTVTTFVMPGTEDRCQTLFAFHITRGTPANATLNVARPTMSKVKVFRMQFHNDRKSAFSAPYSWSG